MSWLGRQDWWKEWGGARGVDCKEIGGAVNVVDAGYESRCQNGDCFLKGFLFHCIVCLSKMSSITTYHTR